MGKGEVLGQVKKPGYPKYIAWVEEDGTVKRKPNPILKRAKEAKKKGSLRSGKGKNKKQRKGNKRKKGGRKKK